MLAQNTGGSIVNVTEAQVNHPVAGINSSVAMMIKGGLEAVTRSLAMEYAKQGLRVNAVAPGVVEPRIRRPRAPLDGVLGAIGDTPLVAVRRLVRHGDVEVWAKLDEMARRRSTPESKSSRSAEVERAVRGAKMPKVRQTGGT